jgi:hypothetical protein
MIIHHKSSNEPGTIGNQFERYLFWFKVSIMDSKNEEDIYLKESQLRKSMKLRRFIKLTFI